MRRTRTRGIASTVALSLAVGSFGALAPLAVASSASATVPGTPGTAQAPTAVYTENFENTSGTSPTSILNYTGAAAAANQTYTADSSWTPAYGACNGWVMSFNTTAPASDAGCTSNAWGSIQDLAKALGQAQGQSAAASASNHALSEYTNLSSGQQAAGYEFKTATNTIPSVAGHFYAISAYFAATSCWSNQPSETFYLVENGTPVALSSGLNPCTDPSAVTYNNGLDYVAKLQSAAIQLPVGSTPSLGIQIYNARANGNGNDVAFDLPQILDVTPQLDKSFSPTSIVAGQTSTLTYTITNTTDLAAKSPLGFKDTLPAGLTATGVNTNSCGGTLTAVSGGLSAELEGGALAQGQTSCTITVQVKPSAAGTYTNNASNFNSGTPTGNGLNGLNPPGSTTLTVAAPAPAISVVKSTTTTLINTVGQQVPFSFKVTNTGNVALTSVSVADAQTSPSLGANMSAISCPTTTLAPSASTTCTATYTTTQADADAGSVTNTAVAQGTQPPTATNPSPAPTTSGPSSAIVTIPPVAALTLNKTANLTSITSAGQQVVYSFKITNTGNVTVSKVGVDEGQFSGTGSLSKIACPTTTLAPGASVICTASYQVTAQDIAAGHLDNTAVPTGITPGQPKPVVGPPSSVIVPVVPPNGITVNTGAVGSSSASGYGDLQMLELIAGMLLIAMAGAGFVLRREKRE